MPTTDGRTWSRKGRSLSGVAPGQREIRMPLVPVPGDGPPISIKEREALLDQLADIHNGLTPAEHRVMTAIREASASGEDWPLTRTRVSNDTGISLSHVGTLLDELEAQGFVEQTDPAEPGRRLVRLAPVKEGAKR